jgi:hypothetical protein
VHGSPSSQVALVRHCQTPPWLVQCQVWPPQLTVWHSSWIDPSQVKVPPPPQVPVAPAVPHPVQIEARVIELAPQVSPPPQDPAVVEQPATGAQAGWQQPAAVQAVVPARHEQSAQSPPPSQYRSQLAG